MTFDQAECSVRVTFLLEYLDFTLDTCIHLITYWLLLRFFSTTARAFFDDYSQLQTDFQFTTLSGT